MPQQNTKIDLNAVIVALMPDAPSILIGSDNALPSGVFGTQHRTLEQALRDWAGLPLGYVEQLYTFADRDRITGRSGKADERIVSIGYLALMRPTPAPTGMSWSPWYRHFPWEDHRKGRPEELLSTITSHLKKWCAESQSKALKHARQERIAINFPIDPRLWNDELVLQRYELLWEAGLMAEGHQKSAAHSFLGIPLAQDHRRILATAIARLRAKIKYRPVVFELMGETFTLLQLQQGVEALAGLSLHKQNFRRLVEQQGLVEETGSVTQATSGRPAKLFRFRRDVLQTRAISGTKLPRVS